jgi:AraC-like DNA-binding protein
MTCPQDPTPPISEAQSIAVQERLREIKLALEASGVDGDVSASGATFGEVSIVRLNLPRTRIEWNRDQGAVDRVPLIFVLSGSLRHISGGRIVQRGPNALAITPGASPVRLETVEDRNDVIYVASSASVIGDVLPGPADVVPDGAPDEFLLAPLLAFVMQACAISDRSGTGIAALSSSALEVARSLAQLMFSDGLAPRSLHGRAMEIIASEHSDPDLSPQRLASRLGVSTRSLQLEFQARGTTIRDAIREVRVATATRLRSDHPDLVSAEVARRSGFGSAATLFRALRKDEPSSPGA